MGVTERSWGVWADVLTAGRLVLAIPIGITAYAGEWTATALLLSAGWWSDFFDGKLARRASEPTRLGRWDMAVDTLVGAALIVGLVVGAHVPGWVGVMGAILAIGAGWLRNLSMAMLVQATGYAPVLWFVVQTSLLGSLVVLGTVALIALIDWRQFVEWTLPTFFNGLIRRREA